MNIIAEPAIANSLRSIALTAIRPSTTAIQTRRRKRFKEAKLLELTESIKAQGVLQPILVRPTCDGNADTYEIAAGERRWIAAGRAGLAEIDCNVRDLTDAQVIEAQLVENLQRDDLDPIEEAEGYRELLSLKQMKAEDMGALIGKSRAYVYARLKLLDLCDEARVALDAGTLDASKALLIARFKTPKLQRSALKRLNNSPQYSYQYAARTLRDNFMVDLAQAPFSRADSTFFQMQKIVGKRGQEECVDLPACLVCPSYSRNDAELQATFDADAHVCIDRACYDAKVDLVRRRKLETYEKAGKTVLTGDAAKAAIPPTWSGVSDRYLNLDAESQVDFHEPEPKATGDTAADEDAYNAWDDRASRYAPPTYRNLLGDEALAGVEIVLAESGAGEIIELVPVGIAAKLLKGKGIKLAIPQPQRELPGTETPDRRDEEARQEERRAREQELRRRVFVQIHAKWKGPLTQPELHRLIVEIFDRDGYPNSLHAIYGDKLASTGSMKEAELVRICALLSVVSAAEHIGEGPAPLFALAKRLRIDPDKIKKEIALEAKGKANPGDASPKEFKKLLDKAAPKSKKKKGRA